MTYKNDTSGLGHHELDEKHMAARAPSRERAWRPWHGLDDHDLLVDFEVEAQRGRHERAVGVDSCLQHFSFPPLPHREQALSSIQ
eukprot:3350307-Prymnesium_polylepis.1